MLSEAESQLVLSCARQRLGPPAAARLGQALAAPLRWDRIIRIAARHGVAPLLHRHLGAPELAEAVPTRARRQLVELYLRGAHQTLHLLRALGDLLARFRAGGLPVVVLKGGSLAQLLYHDATLRPFGDLDVLIRKDDLERARDVLFAAGYRFPPGLLPEGFIRQYHFNLPMVKQGAVQLCVELHWSLTDRFTGQTPDLDGLWARACSATLSGQETLILSPEDLISHLAVHLDMHGYLNRAVVGREDAVRFVFDPSSENRLIWFTDLYEAITASGDRIDWAALVDRGKRAGTSGAIGTSLALLNALYGPVVEPRVLEWLGPPRLSLVKRGVFRWLASGMDRDGDPDSGSRGFFRSRVLPTRQAVQFRLIRLLDVWEYVLPPADVVRRRYHVHRPWQVVFYLFHVANAFVHGGRIALALGWWLLKARMPRATAETP